MNFNIPRRVLSTLNDYFEKYDFYFSQPKYIPNDNTPFGNWIAIEVDNNNNNYTLECTYSYSRGKSDELAKCTVYIINGSFKPNRTEFKSIVESQASDNYY